MASFPTAYEDGERIPAFATSFVKENLTQVMQEFANDFKIMCEDFATYIPGREMSLKMTEHHMHFQNLLDHRTEGFLSQLPTDQDKLQLLLERVAQETEAGKALVDNLLSYALDFEAFAAMMHEVYRDAHPIQHVRVLWDIENLGLGDLRKKQAGLIEPLLRALASFGYPKTADTRIVSFAPPGKVPKHSMDILIDSRVKLVNSKSSKEAADHELKAHASDEMKVLSPESTAFVIISSDKDFNATIKECRERGFATAVIHDAERGSNHEILLHVYADQVARWRDFVIEEGVGGKGDDEDNHGGKGNGGGRGNYGGRGKGGGRGVVGGCTGGKGKGGGKRGGKRGGKHANNEWGDLLKWAKEQVRGGIFVTETYGKDGGLWLCELTVGQHPPLRLGASAGFSKKQARNASADEALDLLEELGLMQDYLFERREVFHRLTLLL